METCRKWFIFHFVLATVFLLLSFRHNLRVVYSLGRVWLEKGKIIYKSNLSPLIQYKYNHIWLTNRIVTDSVSFHWRTRYERETTVRRKFVSSGNPKYLQYCTADLICFAWKFIHFYRLTENCRVLYGTTATAGKGVTFNFLVMQSIDIPFHLLFIIYKKFFFEDKYRSFGQLTFIYFCHLELKLFSSRIIWTCDTHRNNFHL